MEAYSTTINELLHDDTVIEVIYDRLHFVMDNSETKTRFTKKLRNHLATLRSELRVIIETEYVDKVYRDSYYRFFSTKLKNYYRNCIRLSFYEPQFENVEAFINAGSEKQQQWYNGFLVVRPLANSCIGRNAISKHAKLDQGFEICTSSIKSTCIGAKVNVEAFPHSSQDAEYMSCAETTIWTMLEYFGNKYSLYRPALPTEVVDSLDSTAFERMTPTSGLNFQQLSLALKKHGLSTKVYYRNNYSTEPGKFQELFNCYVESGFPLTVCLANPSNKNGGHAVVCIGRQKIDKSTMTTTKTILSGSHNYVFWNAHNNNIVFNDDNFPCYQLTSFDTPTQYYSNPVFNGMIISHFIVPLYCKIYLPAEIAIDASNYLIANLIKAPDGSCVKTFLTSNRSYREYLLNNPDFTSSQKQVYLQIEMPKFVWVTEVSTQSQFKNDKVNAIILLDATGNKSGYSDLSQLIFMQYASNGIVYNKSKRVFEKFSLLLPSEFTAFKGNLK